MFPDQLQHIHDGQHQNNHHGRHHQEQQQDNIDNSTGVSSHTFSWSSLCTGNSNNNNNNHHLFPNSNVDSNHLASASISTSTTPITSSLSGPADTGLDGLGWPLLERSFHGASNGFGLLDAATEESIAAAVEQALSESPVSPMVSSMDASYSSAAVAAAMASTASAAAAATSYSMLPLQFQQQQQRYEPIAAATISSSSGGGGGSGNDTFYSMQQPQKPPKGKPGRKRSHDSSDDDPDVALKRARNNIAAKKYRQKKIDRITELETEVADVKMERDELRVQLARYEAETVALRDLLRLANVKSSS